MLCKNECMSRILKKKSSNSLDIFNCFVEILEMFIKKFRIKFFIVLVWNFGVLSLSNDDFDTVRTNLLKSNRSSQSALVLWK